MTAVPAGVPDIESRTVLISIGLKASIAAAGFATAALAIRLEGSELVLTLAGCGFLIGLLELARRRAKRRLPWLPASTHPLSALIFCALIGASVATLGSQGGLFFLPCLFILGTISVLATPGYLGVCSLLVAGGFLAPGIASGEAGWSEPAAAVVLVILPLGLQRLLRGFGAEAANLPAGGSIEAPEMALMAEVLTPRQVEVTTLLANGLRHQEVADQLGISVHQVRRLIRQARERAGARTTAELVAMSLAPAPLVQAETATNTPN